MSTCLTAVATPTTWQLEHALDELDRRSPGLVIYLAGADPFERDRLGRAELRPWRRATGAFSTSLAAPEMPRDETQVQLGTFRVAIDYRDGKPTPAWPAKVLA
jgi:hypothetical protein